MTIRATICFTLFHIVFFIQMQEKEEKNFFV